MLDTKPNTTHINTSPDLTSLLDVLFIVLIFLLLTISIPVDMLPVTLPEVGEVATETVDTDLPIVSIKQSGDETIYVLDEREYLSLESLLATMTSESSAVTSVAVAADAKVTSESLIQLLAELANADITLANLLISKSK